MLVLFLQAAEEFIIQARSTERRWSRALQHEHSLRLQLQENMEALANQMHGLEDEARLSVQGMLPSLHTVSSHGTAAAETSNDLSLSLTEKKKVSVAPGVALYRTEKEFTETVDGDSDSDDEDKFFDAPEMSSTEWTKSKEVEIPSSSKQQEAVSVGHRRSFSTASVNDTSSMMSASDANIREKFPQISSDRRMAVSMYFTFSLPISL